MISILAVVSLSGLELCCNLPFDPRGPLDTKLVVFSILSTDRNTQFVRVERTYMPAGFDAYAHTQDNFVSGAIVRIQGPRVSSSFQDTTLPRSDMSRYTFPLRSYFARPLVIDHGGSYGVTVKHTEWPEISVSVRVPARPTITMTPLTSLILTSPGSYQDTAEIVYTLSLGAGTKGWIGRLYVYYEVEKSGKKTEERMEVPIYYTAPSMISSTSISTMVRAGYLNHSATVYLNIQYRRTCVRILEQSYPNFPLTFTRAVYELVQCESNLYDYYQTVHAFNDPFSVRLDAPFFTNVDGGVGVIGAYTLDSLVQVLPANFTFNR